MSRSVGNSLTLSDFHSVGVSGPSQSVCRRWDVMYFLKGITLIFLISIFCVINFSWGGGGGWVGISILRMVQFSHKIGQGR